MFLPILSAVLQATVTTLDKAILSIRKVTDGLYTGVSFPIYFVTIFIVYLIFRPSFPDHLFAFENLALIALTVATSIGVNYLYYRALDKDPLSEMQTLALLPAIPLVFIASIFFQNERQPVLILPALVAAGAVVWSHWKHHHFQLAKRCGPYLAFALLISPFEDIAMKRLLETWDIVALQVVRSAIFALFFGLLLLRIKHRDLPRQAIAPLILTNVLSAIGWLLYYSSYQQNGIIYTVLIFSLQPILVYFASLAFLKEKFEPKKVVAFIVILAAVTVAQIWG